MWFNRMWSTGAANGGRPDRLDALTSVRFFFALMVVGTHFCGYHPTVLPTWAAPLGGIAVSWFFILSGFILAYNFPILSSPSKITQFLISRFWRLFPVQLATIVASLLLFPSGWGIVNGMPSVFYQALTLTQTWTAIPFTSQVFNVPAWSISCEWFFYLMFPLLIAALGVTRIAIVTLAAGVALAWATVHGCWSSQAAFQNGGDSLHVTCYMLTIYWPPIRLWEFTLGIGVCDLVKGLRQQGVPAWWQPTLVVVALIVFAERSTILGTMLPGYFASFFTDWLLSALAGAVLIGGLALNGYMTRWMSFPPLVFCGEVSFSIYMTHMLVLRYFSEHEIGVSLTGWAQFAFVCLLTFAISSIIYLAVESPSRKLLKAAFARIAIKPRQVSIVP